MTLSVAVAAPALAGAPHTPTHRPAVIKPVAATALTPVQRARLLDSVARRPTPPAHRSALLMTHRTVSAGHRALVPSLG